ncbi:MAG: c-type cytochrome [Bryobacteraceae bacterium]
MRELAKSSAVAQARLLALYLCETLGCLDAGMVQSALKDQQPQVREHAIQLAEAYPALEPTLVAMTGDRDMRVQMQLALSLGNFKSPAARAGVVSIAAAYPADRWIRMAALSSAADEPGRFFQALLAKGPAAVSKEMLETCAALIGTRKQPAEIQTFVGLLDKLKESEAGLSGLARGLKLAGAHGLKAPGIEAALAKYLNAGSESAWDVARFFAIPGLVDRATTDALSANTPAVARARAVQALRGADFAKALPVIQKVLASNPPVEVQNASVLTLSSFDDPGVAKALLGSWKAYLPDARAKAIGALLAQKNRIPVLLDAIEGGTVPANALEVGARNRMLELNDATLAARAKKALQASASDRAKVIAGFKDALQLSGNVDHGKQIFEDACAKCHLPRKTGGRIGPDLSGINMKTKEELLNAILDPSAAIEPRFVNYLVTTKDGRMYDGVLANETPGAVTLRGGSEEDVTILRQNIAEIRSSNISLMPEDLEKNLKKQDIADLIAYLRGGL